MEQPYAEASCVLKVNVHCQACKMKMMEVLGSICGVYNVDINSEEGLVRVYAVVDPNLLMKALARTGYHAELKYAKLRHPNLNRGSYDNAYDSYDYGFGHNYKAINDPYSYKRALSDPYSYHGHPSHYYSSGISSLFPYHHGSNPYNYGSGLPPARYVRPSYPPKEYDPYADESPISFCSIM